MQYFSQFEQDKFLDQKIFTGKQGGFFVEIGADDGLKYSNTYFFEKFRSWKGLCIEPRKNSFEKLVKNRKALCENCCISDASGTKEFLEIPGQKEQWSGLVEKYDKRQLARIDEIIDKATFKKSLIQVRCENLNDLAAKHNIKHIDYLSIDTEGGETDILKSIDFSRLEVDVISIENNYGTKEFKKILNRNGFKMVNKLTIDDIFIRRGSVFYKYVYSYDYFITQAKNFYKKIIRFPKILLPEPIKNILRQKIYAAHN